MALNPPIDKEIDKVLKMIVSYEGLNKRNMTDSRLLEIRTQANRDMRNAIMTLQFESAGRMSKKVAKNDDTDDSKSAMSIASKNSKKTKTDHTKDM